MKLSPTEATNVRAALAFLRRRAGGWEPLAKALSFKATTLGNVGAGRKAPSPALAFAVARFAGTGVDDVLQGRFPAPGTCPHCGRVTLDEPKAAE